MFRFNDLKRGQCFLLPNKSSLYIKDSCQAAVTLTAYRGGAIVGLPDNTRVIPVNISYIVK